MGTLRKGFYRERFFPVVADSVEEEIEGNIFREHWGFEMGDISTTRKLDYWAKIKAEEWWCTACRRVDYYTSTSGL